MAAPAPKEGAPLMDTLCQVDIVGPFIVDGAELNPGDILSEVQPPYLAPWLHTRARAIATQVEARSTSSIQDGVVTRSFNPYLNCRDLAVASTVSRACHTAAAHMGSLSSCRGCQRLLVLPNRQAGSPKAHQAMGMTAAPRATASAAPVEEIQEEDEEDDDEEDYEEEEEEIYEEEEEEELEEEEEEEMEEDDMLELKLKDRGKEKTPQKNVKALPLHGAVEAARPQEFVIDEKNVRFRAAAEAQLKAEAKALKAWKTARGTDDLGLKAAPGAQAIAEAEEPKIERKDAPGLEQVCQEVKEKVEAASQDMLKAFAEKMLQSLMSQKVPTEELKAAVAQFKVSPETFLMSDANVKAKVSIETSSAGSSDGRSGRTDSEAGSAATAACTPDSKLLVQEMMKLLQSKVQAGKVKSSSGDVEAEIKGLWKVPLTSEVMVQLKGEKEKDGQHSKAVLRGVQEFRNSAPSQDAPKDACNAKVAATASQAASSESAAPVGTKDADEMVVINMMNLNQAAAASKGAAISLKRSFKKKAPGADAATDADVPKADAMTEFQQALTAAASAAGSAQTGAPASVRSSIQDIETLQKVSAKLADQVAELALKAPIEIGWTAKKEEESAAAPKEVEVPVPSVAARSAKSRACTSSEDRARFPDQELHSAAAQNSRPSAIPFQKASEKKAANQEETTQLSTASRPSASPSASAATPAASAVPSAAPSAGSPGAASGGAPAATAASDASPSTAASSVPRRHARLSGMKGFQCNGMYVEDRTNTFIQKAAEVEDPEVSYFLKLYDSWHGNSCADVFQVQAGNNMRTITLAGFEIDGVNVQYRERREPKLMVDQNETYWTANQDFFLFWCGKHSRWRVGRATDWARIQSGDPLSVAEGPQNCVDLRAPSKGWHEWKAPKWVYRKHAGITSVSSSGPRGERVIASCAPDGWRISAQRQTKQRGSAQWRPAQTVKLEIQNAGSTAWSLYPQNCRYEDEAAAADRCMEELLRAEGTATSASNRSPKASRHKQKLETPTDTPTAKSSASKAPKQQPPEEGAEERLLRLRLQAEEELIREEEEEDKRRQEEAHKRKEAKRRREQEESRRKEAAEGARSREEKARKAREEEARKAREEEAKKAREELAARRAAEEEARRLEERRKKEEERQRLEAEKARKAAEKKQKAEERRRQEAEAKRKLEEEKIEEARRQADIKQKELEQAQCAEEERHRRELEQQQREEEAKRRRELEQQQREREEEAKRRAEEARKQAEAKKKWLDQARSREEERRRAEEEARRKNEENRKRAEQEVIRRLQASRAEAEMRKRREDEAVARAAAYPVEAEMEKQRQFANNASHSQLNMEPALVTLSVAEADRGAGQSRRGNDYSDAPMVRPRDEGIVEPTLCQVTLQYNATNVGYLTVYPAEWIVVQCFEGGDEWEAGGWGYGYVRGDEKRCGWLPQRVLNMRG